MIRGEFDWQIRHHQRNAVDYIDNQEHNVPNNSVKTYSEIINPPSYEAAARKDNHHSQKEKVD